MGSTHASLNYHLVFGTKCRIPYIAPPWRDRLHSWLGGMISSLGGVSLGVGGTADHVHLLAGLRPSHCLADVLREVKSVSSGWVHAELGVRDFAWQEGYGAFTVGVLQVESVQRYIGNQEEHHRVCTFREEYVAMLRRAKIEFEERFLEPSAL